MGVALILVLTTISTSGWQPSVMVRMASGEPMARVAAEADPEFRFVDLGAHYDGVYFYTIAIDPLARGTEHQLIDKAAYRYGHPGYGWLGWLFSFGRTSAVPLVLTILGIAGIGLAAAGTSLLSRQLGWTPWAGLAAAFHPGLMYSLTALTSETVGAGLLVLTLYWWVRGNYLSGCIAVIGLCFIKEPFVLVPFGLAIWELTRWIADRDLPNLIRRVALLSVGPVLFLGYYFVYLPGRFGEWPFQATEGFFAFPLTGWLRTMRESSVMSTGDFFTSQIGAASGPLLIAAAAALLFGMYRAARIRNAIDLPFLFLALLALCLQPLGVLYPKDMIRELAMPMLLLPLIIALPNDRPDR